MYRIIQKILTSCELYLVPEIAKGKMLFLHLCDLVDQNGSNMKVIMFNLLTLIFFHCWPLNHIKVKTIF